MLTDPPLRRALAWSGTPRFKTGSALLCALLLAACNDSSDSNNDADNGDDAATTFTVNAVVGPGGAISPESAQAESGEVLLFEVTVEEGYELIGVGGCEGGRSGTTYTTGPITADCTVTVRLEAQAVEPSPPHPISAQPGNGFVDISWDQAEDAEGYNLYWGPNPDIHPLVISSFEQQELDVTSPHTVAELDNDTTYYFVVTSTRDAFESEASVEVSATPFAPPASGGLNDTGIDWCYDEQGAPIAQDGTAQQKADGCEGVASDLPGQDGAIGRDALARQDRIDDSNTAGKIGAGAAGFDFTKLDQDGAPLPASADQWSCVQDNQTGLIWEVKSSSFGLQNRANTYAWYNTDDATNGGDPGQAGGGFCNGSTCNTQAYVTAVNDTELCGLDNWRLPSRNELMSLRHSGLKTVPPIDEDYFPNTVTDRFWTSTPAANNKDEAWFIHFGNPSGSTSDPHIGTEGKHNTNRVRLVSGGAE